MERHISVVLFELEVLLFKLLAKFLEVLFWLGFRAFRCWKRFETIVVLAFGRLGLANLKVVSEVVEPKWFNDGGLGLIGGR